MMKISRIILYILLIVYFDCKGYAQVKNGSFEFTEGMENIHPTNWGLGRGEKGERFLCELDNTEKYEGGKSLIIENAENVDSSDFLPFSQEISFRTSVTKIFTLSAYIKVKNAIGFAGLWCAVTGEKESDYIYFNSLEAQNIKIRGDSDWKKYTVTVIVRPECRKIFVGGFLVGRGTAWFDFFEFKEVKQSKKIARQHVRKYINEICDTIKAYAIYADSINWKKLDRDIDRMVGNYADGDNTDIFIEYIMNTLHQAGDNHSGYYTKNTVDDYRNTIDKTLPHPEFKLIEGKYGLIKVPGFGSVTVSSILLFANKIQEIIKKLDTENNIEGWIVDLSANTGGNMYPMIAGLGPLLGNDTVGYFINPKKNLRQAWYYHNGKMKCGAETVVNLVDYYNLKNKKTKIAVLISDTTSSSGEMTAISFIGKPEVKTFGQKSGGYTTANAGYELSDGSYLNLASAFVADRNMKEYFGSILPEVITTTKEEAFHEAIKWLGNK